MLQGKGGEQREGASSGSLTMFCVETRPQSTPRPDPDGAQRPLAAPQAFCRPPSFCSSCRLSMLLLLLQLLHLWNFCSQTPWCHCPLPHSLGMSTALIPLYNLFIASFIASSMTVIWFRAVLALISCCLLSLPVSLSHAVYKSDKVKLTERYVGSRNEPG